MNFVEFTDANSGEAFFINPQKVVRVVPIDEGRSRIETDVQVGTRKPGHDTGVTWMEQLSINVDLPTVEVVQKLEG